MLAQTIEPLGGWGQLMIQAGAFGLLTYIVVFLFPTMRKEERDEREKRDAAFQAVIDALHEKFDERNSSIVDAVKDQTISLTTAMRDGEKSTREAMLTVCRNVRH